MSRRLALLACVAAAGAAPDNADVAAYVRGLGAVVPHCSPVSQGTCIYVDGAGGIVHARDMYRTKVAGKGKQMLMDMMLRGAVEALAAGGAALPGRWTSFNMVYTAAGPTKRRPFPTLAIGKREPHRPGLLIPNPFFVSPAWWADHAARTLRRAASRPFRGQRPGAVLVGAPQQRADRGHLRLDGGDEQPLPHVLGDGVGAPLRQHLLLVGVAGEGHRSGCPTN